MRTTLGILIIILGFVSCSKEIEITESQLTEDQLYLADHIRPFTGKCKIVYHNSDKIKEVLTYRNGRPDGEAIYYYINGNIKWKGFYRKGYLSGKWQFWNEEGKLIYEVHYRNDTLQGEYRSYYPNGNMKEKGSYMNNSRTGEWIAWSEEGKITTKKEIRINKN